jgi:hypothetical protein
MKYFALLFYFVASSVCYCQTQQLYDLAFSRQDNLRSLTVFGGKIPKTFYVIDTTNTWSSTTFYLKDTNLNDPDVLAEINKDEHHPYNLNYFFREECPDTLINTEEKIRLSEIAPSTSSIKINLEGGKFKTVSKFPKKKGYYFILAEPVYTSDKKYAFVKISVKSKSKFLGELIDEYYAIITIMFERDSNNNWVQVDKNDFLIM